MRELHRKEITIVASVSCADLYHLARDIPALAAAGVDLLHFDVVDGRFNDCMILGTPTLEALRPHTDLPIEVHLGVYEPERFIDQFVAAGADYIAVHYEVLEDPMAVFEQIRRQGARPLLALRAETAVDPDLLALLPHVDWVIALTVNPGYAGQRMQLQAVEKIRVLRKHAENLGLRLGIEADGNIHSGTIPLVVQAGADMLTGGTSGLFLPRKSLQETAAVMRSVAQDSLVLRSTNTPAPGTHHSGTNNFC